MLPLSLACVFTLAGNLRFLLICSLVVLSFGFILLAISLAFSLLLALRIVPVLILFNLLLVLRPLILIFNILINLGYISIRPRYSIFRLPVDSP